jgi:hypothetical protein
VKTILEHHVPHNTGWSGEMKHGEIIRITAATTVDFVFFKLQNLLERFDQPTIMADGFTQGTHDLQKGMCSGYRFQLAKQENRLGEYYPREIDEIPDHGCY